MATMSRTKRPRVRELTDEEWLDLVDREARRYLNMSGEEFVRRWKAGEIDPNDPSKHSAIVRISMLLPGIPFGR